MKERICKKIEDSRVLFCLNKNCSKYITKKSIRTESFLINFNITLKIF